MKQDTVDKDPLFARLRQQAESMDTGDALQDLPSPGVWLAVQAANNRRKKRRAAWMFWGLASGLLLPMLWWAYMPNINRQVPPIAQAIKYQASSNPQASYKQAANSIEKNLQLFEKQAKIHNQPQHSIDLRPPELSQRKIDWKAKRSNTPAVASKRAFLNKAALPPFQPLAPMHTGLSSTQATTEAWNKPLPLATLPPKISLKTINRSIATPPIMPVAALKSIERTRPHKQIYFSLQTGLFLTTLKLRSSASGQLPNGQERAAISWQQGFGAGLHLNRHWGLEVGVQLSTHHLKATRVSELVFKSNEERFDPLKQVYTGTVKQDLQTSFGEVEMRYDINRIAGQPVIDQTPLKVAFETDERVRYLRLPFSLHYRRSLGRKTAWGIQAGTGLNVLTGYHFQVAQSNTQTPEIRSVDARNLNQAQGLTTVLADAQIGVSGQLQLSRHLQFSMEVEGRRGLQSMYENADFKSYPMAVGLQLGLRWQLSQAKAHQ